MKRRTDKNTIAFFRNRYPVKQRIFLYYMLFFAFLSVFTVVMNILSGFDFSFNYKWFAICLFCLPLAVLAYRKMYINLIHRLGTYIIALVILPVCWLSSAALVSPSIIYSVVVMLLINFLLVGGERIILNALFILTNIGLITLYRLHPEVYKTLTPHEQFLDWVINVPVMFIFIAVLLTIFERAYEDERILNYKKTEKLEKISRTDYLTGMNNRLYLMDDLAAFHTDYRKRKIPFSVIILDIDYFKMYNDHYGHIKGDECLQVFSQILIKNAARENDHLYRYGGEEFLLLLGETDKEGALSIADKLKAEITQKGIPHLTSQVASVITASMGIATMNDRVETIITLLKEADTALYRSKESGRNAISHYEDIQPIKIR